MPLQQSWRTCRYNNPGAHAATTILSNRHVERKRAYIYGTVVKLARTNQEKGVQVWQSDVKYLLGMLSLHSHSHATNVGAVQSEK